MSCSKLKYLITCILTEQKVAVFFLFCNSLCNITHPLLGHHLGAKKMLRMLLKDYFWRNAQLTVVEYIKNCTVCTSNSTFPLEPLANKNQINPWRNVEFHWLEPVHSQQNNCLALIYDPASFWLSAAPILFNSFEISLFMFENFCNHGKMIFMISCEFTTIKT